MVQLDTWTSSSIRNEGSNAGIWLCEGPASLTREQTQRYFYIHDHKQRRSACPTQWKPRARSPQEEVCSLPRNRTSRWDCRAASLRLIKTHMYANGGRTRRREAQPLAGYRNLFTEQAPADAEQLPCHSSALLSHASYRHPGRVAGKVNRLHVKFMQTRKPKQSTSLFSSTN